MNKYLKQVQGYSFRICLELDHVLSMLKNPPTTSNSSAAAITNGNSSPGLFKKFVQKTLLLLHLDLFNHEPDVQYFTKNDFLFTNNLYYKSTFMYKN